MKASTTTKTIASIATCVLAGAFLLQCGPTNPITGEQGTGGNAGGGVTGTSPTAGAGGHSAAGNGSGGYIITPPPPAGGSTEVIKFDAAPASPDANCGTQTQNPTPQLVDLLLVLDRSGSMADDIATDKSCTGGGAPVPCSPKWPAMTDSLNQVLKSSPAQVQWGLKFFSSPNGQACTVNPGADVAVGKNTAAKIQTAMNNTSPANNTPTMAAIKAAVAYFGTVNDSLAHYILLATDGLPNCDPGTSGTVTDTSIQDAADAIATALKAGIKTYVVGIGASSGNLDNFAKAGGTGNYFPVTSPDQLTAALSSIVVSVASCTFTMAKAPDDPNNLGVYLDQNTKVPRDASDGYSLASDNLTVTFNGSYCDGLKNGTYQVVQVFFGCPGKTPPLYL